MPEVLTVATLLDVLGVFVQVFRDRFTPVISNTPTLAWAWNEDPKQSSIVIDASPLDNTELRNKRPGIAVGFTQCIHGAMSYGNQDTVSSPTFGMRSYALKPEIDLEISALSVAQGESLVLGEICQDTISEARQLIIDGSSLDSISPSVILNRPRPYETDRNIWESTVQFRVTTIKRWATMPISPVLRKARLHITAGDDEKVIPLRTEE